MDKCPKSSQLSSWNAIRIKLKGWPGMILQIYKKKKNNIEDDNMSKIGTINIVLM